jgi:hypothetical protein
VKLSGPQIRKAARYRALRSLVVEIRRLVTMQDEDCWAREHPAVEAAVAAEALRLERAADKIADEHPWVTDCKG